MRVRGLEQLRVNVQSHKQLLAGALGDDLEAGAWVLANEAQRRAVYSSGIIAFQEGEKRAVAEATHPGAKIHEFGGVITPKDAEWLQFEVDGEWVKTKKVNMPARPYMRPAIDTKKSEIAAAIAESISRRIS